MKVSALTVDPFTSLPVVILEDDVGGSRLGICVGLGEASAIAAELDRIELERPMTHHLMRELLAKTGAKVRCVEVSDLQDSTFYATVHLCLADGSEVAQDARPSDALALALSVGAEVRVAPHVLEKAASQQPPELEAPPPAIESVTPLCGGAEPQVAGDEAAEYLVHLGDDAFGKWKM